MQMDPHAALCKDKSRSPASIPSADDKLPGRFAMPTQFQPNCKARTSYASHRRRAISPPLGGAFPQPLPP